MKRLLGIEQWYATCNRLDSETLGFQPNMPKNLPKHCLDFFITLLSAVGPQHITIRCCEFNLNLSLVAQHFEHQVGLGNTKISTNYAQKSPQTLF